MSDKSNPRALWMACGRGDVEVATAQLNSGDKINAREPNVSRLPIRHFPATLLPDHQLTTVLLPDTIRARALRSTSRPSTGTWKLCSCY
jgi:hypothetical protein